MKIVNNNELRKSHPQAQAVLARPVAGLAAWVQAVLARPVAGLAAWALVPLGLCVLFSLLALPACSPTSQNPIPVIFETDMGNDIDDALALDMLYKYSDRGLIQLLGVSSNKESQYSPAFIDALNTWCGYPDIPIGWVHESPYKERNLNNYAKIVSEMKQDGRPLFPVTAGFPYEQSVTLYRRLLASQANKSVVIISVGFSTNLGRLLDSPPDAISPLDGEALVKKKVKALYTMAGSFGPDKMKEYNVVNDIENARNVFSRWPTPIMTTPFEIGLAVTYPGSSIANDFSWAVPHPVVEAYKAYMPMPYDRPTWDMIAVMSAIDFQPTMMHVSEKGTVSVSEDGYTTFTPGTNGRHTYLTVDSLQARAIRDYFTQLIPQPPAHRAAGQGTGSNPSPKHMFVYTDQQIPTCHASTLVETTAGDLLVAFFGGTHEGHPDSSIWLSRLTSDASPNSGNPQAEPPYSWTTPVCVADGMVDGVKTACWNPVLFQVPDGDLLLFYKVGTEVQKWSGYVIRSKDGGHTWTSPELLPGDQLGPIKNKPLLLGNTLLCPSSLEKGGWRVRFEHYDITALKGQTLPAYDWQASIYGPINDVHQTEIIQPALLQHGDGTLQVLCRNRQAGQPIITSYSTDQGCTWSTPQPTALPNNNSGLDAVTLNDGRFMVVYNHVTTLSRARTPLNVATSSDGVHWQPYLELENTPDSEFSYPAIIQTRDGSVWISYTWKRKRIAVVKLSADL